MQYPEREGIFPLEVSDDGFLHVGTNPEQGTTILLQADTGVNDDEITSEQAVDREEFATLSKKRQQQTMKAWGNDQTKQFDPGG